MEISPADNGFGEVVQTEVTDICRICHSPEEPDNPLRHPCACRGSLKYVHEDCLFLWINRRRRKHCEICKRRYSIVPVYSENAPERLPCSEFLKGLLLRAYRFTTLFLPWLLVIPFNAYLSSFRPLGKQASSERKRVFGLSCDFPGLFYTAEVVLNLTLIVVLRVLQEEIFRMRPELLHRLNLIDIDQWPRVVTRTLLVLSIHMRILLDWWQDQLSQLPYSHIFLRGPLVLALVPRNTQLHEFGAMRKFLHMLDDNTFAVLAINIYWSFFNLLLPFSIGRIVLLLLRCFPYGWIWENVSEVTVGEMVLLCLCFGFLRRVFPRPRNISPTTNRRLSLSLILCFKIILLPWILGCWIGFCSSPITGTMVVPSHYPLMAIKYWLMGTWYLGFALSCMDLIQKIVQKRVFWYLLDVTEPSYKVTKLYLGPILFAFAFHGAVVVILLHLPIKTIAFISQSFFPLRTEVYKDEFVVGLLAAYMCIARVSPRWLANFVKPSIKPIVQQWVVTVSSWLKLSDFLLGVPQREGGFRPANHHVRPLFRMFGVAEGSLVSFYRTPSDTSYEEDANEDQQDQKFMLRIGVMLVLAALSIFLVSTTFMALPILVGRAFFNSISFFMLSLGLEHDDLCAFWIGLCIMRGLYIITCFFYDNMSIKNVLLFSTWISVIPGLLGLLIDLMIITPSQVPRDESLVSILLQNWLAGVVVLHIWIFLTMFTLIKCFATVRQRRRLQRIRSVGINQLPLKWLIRNVIGSALTTLLLALCVPYLVVNSILPILGLSDASNLTVKRLIWPGLLAKIIIWFSAKLSRDLIVYIHQVEFDKRYKVGERLVDFH